VDTGTSNDHLPADPRSRRWPRKGTSCGPTCADPREDGQTWRTLLVIYPDTLVAHHRRQTCYFDDAGLLWRLDYSVDILGGGLGRHRRRPRRLQLGATHAR